MQKRIALFLFLIAVAVCKQDLVASSVPALDSLAGDWQNVDTVRSMPAISSSQGSGKTARDVLALEHVSFPPVTMNGNTGQLFIDGKPTCLTRSRWYPYQVLRESTVQSLSVESAVRLAYARQAILFRIKITNNYRASRNCDLSIELNAHTSRHSHWGWDIPLDKSKTLMIANVDDDQRSFILTNPNDQLVNVFEFVSKPDELLAKEDGGQACWHLALAAGESKSIDYVLAIGKNLVSARPVAEALTASFDAEFNQVQKDWQDRFDAMFTPGNRFFSGYLPTLVTPDADLSRVYYISALSALSVCRTSFPIAPRVYTSNAPAFDCTMIYFWDTREWASTLCLLDPQMVKLYLRGWLKKGIYDGYSEEYLTGTMQGPWYSANDLSVFVLLDTYLNITGDRAFLDENIASKSVLQHMDDISTHWKRLVRPGRTLADYGEAYNLLECVPTYIHEVPSFNAANVWMMRRTAALQNAAGNADRARELHAEVDRLLPAVLDLYEPGKGVWVSLHHDGTRVEMRHVLDFTTIGLYIKDDLPADTRTDMSDFVERELLTDHWMRAQSLSDPAAGHSDRPDHGPMGAFSAWPAETMATFCEFGQYDRAVDLLHRIAPVTTEGPFSQSRELMDKTPHAQVRIAQRGLQDYYVSSGASFTEAIIRDFFGFQPDLLDTNLKPSAGPRGFSGQLLNLRAGNWTYNATVESSGLKLESIPAPAAH